MPYFGYEGAFLHWCQIVNKCFRNMTSLTQLTLRVKLGFIYESCNAREQSSHQNMGRSLRKSMNISIIKTHTNTCTSVPAAKSVISHVSVYYVTCSHKTGDANHDMKSERLNSQKSTGLSCNSARVQFKPRAYQHWQSYGPANYPPEPSVHNGPAPWKKEKTRPRQTDVRAAHSQLQVKRNLPGIFI